MNGKRSQWNRREVLQTGLKGGTAAIAAAYGLRPDYALAQVPNEFDGTKFQLKAPERKRGLLRNQPLGARVAFLVVGHRIALETLWPPGALDARREHRAGAEGDHEPHIAPGEIGQPADSRNDPAECSGNRRIRRICEVRLALPQVMVDLNLKRSFHLRRGTAKRDPVASARYSGNG